MVFMSVYTPLIVAYVYYADSMFDKAVDAIDGAITKMFAAKEKVAATMAGEFVAMYGEAVDA